MDSVTETQGSTLRVLVGQTSGRSQLTDFLSVNCAGAPHSACFRVGAAECMRLGEERLGALLGTLRFQMETFPAFSQAHARWCAVWGSNPVAFAAPLPHPLHLMFL
jgi:hypothetical protein